MLRTEMFCWCLQGAGARRYLGHIRRTPCHRHSFSLSSTHPVWLWEASPGQS